MVLEAFLSFLVGAILLLRGGWILVDGPKPCQVRKHDVASKLFRVAMLRGDRVVHHRHLYRPMLHASCDISIS